MGKITVSSSAGRLFEKNIRDVLSIKVNKAANKSRLLLVEQAAILLREFQQSQEFNALKTTLVGEFGFTPEEVVNLNRVFQLLLPQNEVTKTTIKATKDRTLAVLDWVDFDKLKEHSFAQHPLTRFNAETGQFEITQIISWVEWLEEGATVRGYVPLLNLKPNMLPYSRSGKGLMIPKSGGIWTFPPTSLFRNIAESFKGKVLEDFKKGIGILISRTK